MFIPIWVFWTFAVLIWIGSLIWSTSRDAWEMAILTPFILVGGIMFFLGAIFF